MIFSKVVHSFDTEETDKLLSHFGHIDKGSMKRVLWWYKYGSTGLKQAYQISYSVLFRVLNILEYRMNAQKGIF